MLLPDMKQITRWSGNRSIGGFLLDIEVHDRDRNTTEHRILSDLLRGKAVSSARLRTLCIGIAQKWPIFAEHYEPFIATIESQDGSFLCLQDSSTLGGAVWHQLPATLPEKYRKTKELLGRLAEASAHLSALAAINDVDAIVGELRGLSIRSKIVAPHQSRFYAEMAELFARGEEEVAKGELCVYGLVLVLAIFVSEFPGTKDLWKILDSAFVVENEHAHPKMAFARWLERLGDTFGVPRDELLWTGFVVAQKSADEVLEKEKKSLLRNARRY